VRGIDHEPLKIGVDNEGFEQFFPNSLVSPANKSPVRVVPSAKIRRQITPWCTRSKNPKYGIDEPAIVPRNTTPRAFSSRQMRL